MSPEDEKLFFATDFMMVPALLEVTKLRIAVQNLCAGFAASAEYLFLGIKVSFAGKKRQGPKMHLRELTLAAPCIDCPFGVPPFSSSRDPRSHAGGGVRPRRGARPKRDGEVPMRQEPDPYSPCFICA